MLLLRIHHNAPGLSHVLLLLPSAALAASPWIFSTPPALAAGLFLHLGWFIACNKLVPFSAATEQTAVPPQTGPKPRTTDPSAGPPRGFVQVPVFNVIRETDDISTFRMARPEGYRFRAGQFLTVRVNVDDHPVARCYTISSAPEAAGYLEISVKRQGLLSGTLHATIRPGSMLAIKSASGGFTYPKGDDRPLALIAGGVGITPMICMLRHAVQADPTRPVTLLYSVHSNSDVAFREELRLLAARNPQVKVVVTTTRGPHEPEYLSGRIDGRMIQEHVNQITDTIFMICGPGPMIEGTISKLLELGVPEGQIRSEAFEAAVASSSTVDSEPGEATPPAASVGEFQLHLVESDAIVAASSDCTILETCEAAGISLPAACRAGVCGTCRSRLVDGKVRCESDLLDDTDRAEGYILPCVSWPEEDCAVEA
jgi:ferredoxin-NADP reductase